MSKRSNFSYIITTTRKCTSKENPKGSISCWRKKVYIDWNDDELTRNYYTYAKDETLQEIEDFQLARMKYFVENNACRISIDSRNPHGMRGVDMGRVMLANRAIGPKTHFFQEHYGSSKSQWTIVAYPNDEWCKTVFLTSLLMKRGINYLKL